MTPTPASRSGLFITLEGGEGAGKSTQMEHLRTHLQSHGHQVLLTREPGGTAEAEMLRRVILDPEQDWDPVEQLLLFNAARHHHWRHVIHPALSQGGIVVCDRYLDSTIAYQGAAGGVNPDLVVRMHDMVFNQAAYPDITLYIDVPVDLAVERRAKRDADTTKDRFEAAELEFHQNLRQGFRDLCQRFPDRMELIDGCGDIDTVSHHIKNAVDRRLNHG